MTDEVNAIELDTTLWPDPLYEKALMLKSGAAKLKIFDSEDGFIILVDTDQGGAIIDLIPDYEEAIERCNGLANAFGPEATEQE
jgi:hypothetical protein